VRNTGRGYLPQRGASQGLARLLTTAHGEVFDPPRAMKELSSKLRSAQKNMSRKFEMLPGLPSLREIPYSNRLKAQIKKVAKIHTAAKNVRRHHHFKNARTIERTYRVVGVEEHGVKFMLANRRTL